METKGDNDINDVTAKGRERGCKDGVNRSSNTSSAIDLPTHLRP